MGKKPLLMLAGLFLAGVAISATGCGQCTQCSTRPGKWNSNGPQAKAPTPAMGDSKRSEVARDTGKKPQPATNGDIVPVGANSFEKMPSTTPMKNVPNTYSGDPPMGSISGVRQHSMPGQEVGEGTIYSARESVAVPTPPATPRNQSEGFQSTPGLPVNSQPSGLNSAVPGTGIPSNEGSTRTGFQAQPAPPAPHPTELSAPPPPPLPKPPIASTPDTVPSGVPSGVPGSVPSGVPGAMPGSVSGGMPGNMPSGIPSAMNPPTESLPSGVPGHSGTTSNMTPPTAPTAMAPGKSTLNSPAKLPGSTPAVPETPRPAPVSPTESVPGTTPPNLPGEDLPPLKQS